MRTDKTKPIINLIAESIKEINSPDFAVLLKLIDSSYELLTEEVLDRADASKFIKNLALRLGYTKREELFNAFINKLNDKNELMTHFNELNVLFESK